MRRPHALPMMSLRGPAFGRRPWRVAVAVLAFRLLVSAGCTRDIAYIGNAAEPADGAPPADGPSLDGGGSADAAPVCRGAALPSPPLYSPWNCGSRCYRVESLAVGIETAFIGAALDPAPENRPVWVYPLADSVYPIDLPEVTLQWRRGPEARRQETFEIRIEGSNPAAPYLLYTPQTGVVDPTPNPTASIFAVPGVVWRSIALENVGAVLQMTVRALSAVDGQVSASDPLPVRFSSLALGGVLTYWSSCAGPDGSDCNSLSPQGIERHFLGSGVRTTLVRAETPAAAGKCVGCHSTSADGERLAFAVDYEGGARVTAVAAPGEALRATTPPVATTPLGFPVLSPDGRRLLVSYGPGATSQAAVLEIYNTEGGAPVFTLDRPTLPEGAVGLHAPAWSPDGKAIAATLYRFEAGRSVTDGDLVLLPWDDQAATLGAPQFLVRQSDTEFHLYPAFSPDGKWIVFATAAKGGTTTPDGHPHTRLQIIEIIDGAGVGPVIALSNASAEPRSPGGAPLGQPATRPQLVGGAGCTQLFVAFSSQRDYGFLSIPTAVGRWNQLWLSALDLGRTGTGQDPSSPPIWLPAQRRGANNRRPVWTPSSAASQAAPPGPGQLASAASALRNTRRFRNNAPRFPPER